MKILVTGATGFVGPKIVHALRAQDRDVRALVRDPARAGKLASLGVELVTGDMTDPVSLGAAVRDCTHVVHLVAILTGKPQDFQRVMTDGTKHLIAAAKQEGVERWIQMSALGTSEQTKDVAPYYAAKWAMEQAVVESGFEYVIFRPSFVFGPGGGALQTFIRQVRLSPIVTIIGDGVQRSQPIWVDDVAAYFAKGVDLPQAANRTFELGGPDVVDWNELYRRIATVLRKRRKFLNVPVGLARTGARLTERLPGAPLSVDQIAMLQAGDNVVSSSEAVEMFGLPLLALDEQIRRSA